MKNAAQLRSSRRRLGQGMTEYILVVGLVAIVTIPAVTKFKDALQRAIVGTEESCSKQIQDACAAESNQF